MDYLPYWIDTSSKPDDPMYEVAKVKARQRKVVFTKTLEASEWQNTELAKGDLVEEVNNLKNESGKNIIVYGGSSFVASLLREGLIDEMHLFVNPVALGRGVSVFSELEGWQALRLKKAITYDSGLVLLNYALPRRAD